MKEIPWYTLAFTKTFITPICSLNLYFTAILIMKNRCIRRKSFKVTLALGLTSDGNKEFKLIAIDTLHCSILRNLGNAKIYHSIRFYVCLLLRQDFNYVYLRGAIFHFN
jgi:NAD kinase